MSCRRVERREHDPDRGGGDWLVDKPDLSMDAAPFLRTLRRLGYVTQDQRYFDLHRDLMSSGMIDRATGKWSRYGTVLAHPDTRLLCEQIEQSIAAGVPEREVLAEAVVEFNIDARVSMRRCNAFGCCCTSTAKPFKKKPAKFLKCT